LQEEAEMTSRIARVRGLITPRAKQTASERTNERKKETNTKESKQEQEKQESTQEHGKREQEKRQSKKRKSTNKSKKKRTAGNNTSTHVDCFSSLRSKRF